MLKNDILVKSALLHDIGKIVMRADRSVGNHSIAGVNFLKQYIKNSNDNKQLLRCIKYHHGSLLNTANIEKDDFAYIVYEADNVSAGMDRRDNDYDDERGFDLHTSLESVFNIFAGDAISSKKLKYPLRGMNADDRFNYPTTENLVASNDKYKEIVDVLVSNFSRADLTDMCVNEVLRIIEDTFSYIPSSTNKQEICDISLYIHSKITAAIADCMKKYFDSNNIVDYKKYCFTKNKEFRDKEAFLLVSADISGIQDFIYNIPSKGALKSLRGRSFYLELFMENFIDELLDEAGLSRANLLYSGGGHFYILAPNTEYMKSKVEELQEKCNTWLLDNFSTKIYLAVGYVPCCANDLMMSSKQRNIFSSVSKIVNKDKLNRYSDTQLNNLFDINSAYNIIKDNSRECSICHTSTQNLLPYNNDKEIYACSYCNGLLKLGETILQEDIVFVISDEQDKSALELFGSSDKHYLYAVKFNEVELFKRNILRIYSKNKSLTGKFISTRLWISDYVYKENGKILTFEELAKSSCNNSQGIKRLGVLRADVDNLGAAFMSGFVNKNLSEPLKYATFARYADLSRDMSMFFKLAIDKICEGEINGFIENSRQAFNLFGIKKNKQRKIHVVYSGGDDMFLVGAWDDLLETAIDIKRAFNEFTNNKLSFSAGIAMFDPAYPISKMAEITGLLESNAKDNKAKNSIALFGLETEIIEKHQKLGCNHVYNWDEFIDKVYTEKLRFLFEHLDFEKNSSNKIKAGKTFIYKLMQLIEQIKNDKINIARFAYTMARMQPDEKNNDILNNVYEEFTNQMYKWIKNSEDSKQLYTALTLLVYYLREGNE